MVAFAAAGLLAGGVILLFWYPATETYSLRTPPLGWGSTRVRGTITSVDHPGAEISIDEIIREEASAFVTPQLRAGDTIQVIRWFPPTLGHRATGGSNSKEEIIETENTVASSTVGKEVVAELTFCREGEFPEAICAYGTGWTAFGTRYTGWLAFIQRWYTRLTEFLWG